MMRYILIGCCFFCSLFLSSCNSTKRLGKRRLRRANYPTNWVLKSIVKTICVFFRKRPDGWEPLTAMEVAPGKESTAPGW